MSARTFLVQLCCILSFEQGILVLDPKFLSFGHGIENSGQFANGGDEGDLFRFAYGTQVQANLRITGSQQLAARGRQIE